MWLTGFLAAPLHELGRAGAVCPYIKQAVDADDVTLAVYDEQNDDEEHVENIVAAHRDSLIAGWSASKLSVARSSLSCRLVIFVGLQPARAARLVDDVQLRMKPSFVERGLMIGQFHPMSEEPGLWNSDFRPLRSPVAMLAIRRMIPTDLPFLTEAYAFRSYLQHHGSDIPSRLQGLADELMELHGPHLS